MVSLREQARLDHQRAPPAWLRQMLETEFFESCPRHPTNPSRVTTRTAGCNFFCTRCPGRALCSACLREHEGHEVIQIRRSSGHNVVKVAEVTHLLSLSLVQTYKINGVDAVFLNRRPMLGHGRPGPSHCEECQRGLQDAYSRFCSFGCKAEGINDRLDFEVSFAVTPKSDSSGDESSDDDDSPPPPTKHRRNKLGKKLSASSCKISARGCRPRR
ncbi:hypothetical protein BS78_04G070900 [Paspalum vaginatum]|nr:hypothetical protein BS78_04G070900 [Paspalum vaginatum]